MMQLIDRHSFSQGATGNPSAIQLLIDNLHVSQKKGVYRCALSLRRVPLKGGPLPHSTPEVRTYRRPPIDTSVGLRSHRNARVCSVPHAIVQ